MSDYDAQLVAISNLALPCIKHLTQYRRIIDEYSICKFTALLSHESWDAIFQNDNINTIFNVFSDTYTKIFQTCFPLKKKLIPSDYKPWLTQGIRTSCANKKKLYNTYRFNNDPGFKQYYKKYCKTLRLLITAYKRKYYDTLISKLSNKTKTTWKIIKTITNKRNNQNKIVAINIKDQLSNNPDIIANSFNAFFFSVAINIIKKCPGSSVTLDPIINLN